MAPRSISAGDLHLILKKFADEARPLLVEICYNGLSFRGGDGVEVPLTEADSTIALLIRGTINYLTADKVKIVAAGEQAVAAVKYGAARSIQFDDWGEVPDGAGPGSALEALTAKHQGISIEIYHPSGFVTHLVECGMPLVPESQST